MPRFSADQVAIAKALMSGSKTLGELRKATGLPADALAGGLKELIKQKLVEPRGEKFALSGEVTLKLEKRLGMGKKGVDKVGEEYVVKMIVEGVSDSREALDNQMTILEGKLKQERVRLLYVKRAEAIENEGNFSSYLDVEAAAPSFAGLINLIVQFGPSSVELIAPDEVKLNAEEAQQALNAFASAIHYYAGLAIQLGQGLARYAKPT